MDYTEAIRLALAGKQSGFSALYEKTYKQKYFLALYYMKNEAAAEDVMQEAYMRAFSKLDTLKEPEKFPGWLGMIVVNIAKNALKKNNPMLFSDIAADNEQEMYQIEDDNTDHMPEIAYTREETRQLTRKIIDSLSEEQRMCILMFHIEGLSVKEIASALGCSENTVKSRLKYGRDNIREKGEELKKKGYQLYSVAPFSLFLCLLQMEAVYMEAEGSFVAAGARIARRVIPSGGGQSDAGAFKGMKEGAGSGVKAVKSGFIHTAAGKAAVTAAVAGLCLIGGAVFYGASQLDTNETVVEPEVKEENEVKGENEARKEEESSGVTVKEVQDSEYEMLIAGNLTKEELQFVLAYGPQEIPEQGFQSSDYLEILNYLCDASENYEGEPMIEEYGPDAEWRSQYSVSDVNRMFHSFTDYQFSEGDNALSEYNVQVQENKVVFTGASIDRTSNAVITSAEYTEEEMEILYTYDTITTECEL